MPNSRKSDIENERLPPDLVDPEEVAPHLSSPATPSNDGSRTAPSANGISSALENAIAVGATSPKATTEAGPGTPPSTGGSIQSPFRRGHGRQQSLGTTMTSPSTRRRSLESTMTLIKEVYDGRAPLQDAELDKLADQVADQASGKNGAAGAAAAADAGQEDAKAAS